MPSSLDRVRDAFESVAGPGKESGQWTTFRCPCHDDSHASAGIAYNTAQGKTTVRCFAGCDNEDILDAIGLKIRDLYDEPITRKESLDPKAIAARRAAGQRSRAEAEARRAKTREDMAAKRAALEARRGAQIGEPELVRSYIYTTADGVPVGAVNRYLIRYEHETAKNFRQTRWDPAKKHYARSGFEPTLYRLPDVAAAIEHGETILLVEGEKDADRAATIGAVATCNAMGAGSFTEEHAEQLRGAARIVIVTDRDEPGYKHAAAVAELLRDRTGPIYVVEAAEGKDLSDHLDAGHALTDLVPVDPAAKLDRPPPHPTRDLITATTGSLHPRPETVNTSTPQRGAVALAEPVEARATGISR